MRYYQALLDSSKTLAFPRNRNPRHPLKHLNALDKMNEKNHPYLHTGTRTKKTSLSRGTNQRNLYSRNTRQKRIGLTQTKNEKNLHTRNTRQVQKTTRLTYTKKKHLLVKRQRQENKTSLSRAKPN